MANRKIVVKLRHSSRKFDLTYDHLRNKYNVFDIYNSVWSLVFPLFFILWKLWRKAWGKIYLIFRIQHSIFHSEGIKCGTRRHYYTECSISHICNAVNCGTRKIANILKLITCIISWYTTIFCYFIKWYRQSHYIW